MTAKQKEERIKKLIEEEKAAREDGENFFRGNLRIFGILHTGVYVLCKILWDGGVREEEKNGRCGKISFIQKFRALEFSYNFSSCCREFHAQPIARGMEHPKLPERKERLNLWLRKIWTNLSFAIYWVTHK